MTLQWPPPPLPSASATSRASTTTLIVDMDESSVLANPPPYHVPDPAESNTIIILDRFIARACRTGASSASFDLAHARDRAADIADAVSLAANAPLVDTAAVLRRVDEVEQQREQLRHLLIAPGITQRTPEWYAARGQLITASDAAQAMGCAKFGTQRQFFAKKCGYEQEAFNPNVPPLKWGTMYEAVATEAYSLRTAGATVHEFGLLRHPRIAFFGASPDGINDLGVMVEIKCPYRRKISGEIPWQYYCQIQGQLDVCSLIACDYVECEIAEYHGWDDFEMSSSECGRLSSEGGEHGFVMEFPARTPDGASTYKYSRQRCTAGELRAEWDALLSAHPEDSASARIHLYRITKMSVLRVERDPSFVRDMIDALGRVWERVGVYRRDMALYDDEVRKASVARKPRATATLAASGAENAVPSLTGKYAFLEDDDD